MCIIGGGGRETNCFNTLLMIICRLREYRRWLQQTSVIVFASSYVIHSWPELVWLQIFKKNKLFYGVCRLTVLCRSRSTTNWIITNGCIIIFAEMILSPDFKFPAKETQILEQKSFRSNFVRLTVRTIASTCCNWTKSFCGGADGRTTTNAPSATATTATATKTPLLRNEIFFIDSISFRMRERERMCELECKRGRVCVREIESEKREVCVWERDRLRETLSEWKREREREKIKCAKVGVKKKNKVD